MCYFSGTGPHPDGNNGPWSECLHWSPQAERLISEIKSGPFTGVLMRARYRQGTISALWGCVQSRAWTLVRCWAKAAISGQPLCRPLGGGMGRLAPVTFRSVARPPRVVSGSIRRGKGPWCTAVLPNPCNVEEQRVPDYNPLPLPPNPKPSPLCPKPGTLSPLAFQLL